MMIPYWIENDDPYQSSKCLDSKWIRSKCLEVRVKIWNYRSHEISSESLNWIENDDPYQSKCLEVRVKGLMIDLKLSKSWNK